MTSVSETDTIIHTDIKRPQLERSGDAARGLSGVWAVLRRELDARLPTQGYIWSTVILAAMAFASPLLFSASADDEPPVVALTAQSERLSPVLAGSAAGALHVETADSRSDGEKLLQDGTADALLVPGDPSGWTLIGETWVNPALAQRLQALLTMNALQTAALDAGVSPDALTAAVLDEVVSTRSLVATGDSRAGVLLGLGFGVVIVFIIILWGATMASDVVQEKATRVVEILIATIRPWQLLTGKVLALTIVGLLQIAVVLAAAYAGMELFGGGLDLSAMSPPILATGLVSVSIGVPLLATLMAAMAARVEHQDDLGTATQPVYLLLMAPFAAAVYAGLHDPTGPIMQLLSIAPITNIFAMPARIGAEIVPAWQLGLSLLVGILTLAGSVLLAGRIYANSILRAGSAVSLRQALTSR